MQLSFAVTQNIFSTSPTAEFRQLKRKATNSLQSPLNLKCGTLLRTTEALLTNGLQIIFTTLLRKLIQQRLLIDKYRKMAEENEEKARILLRENYDLKELVEISKEVSGDSDG